MTPIRALVIDDDPLASPVLCRTLEQAGCVIVAEAPSGPAGIELARRYAPDVLFVDLLLPEVDGVAVIEAVNAMDLGIRAILLTIGRSADEGLAAIRAGARGYLSRSDLLTGNLPRLLAVVMAEELVCSRSMLTSIVERLLRSPALGAGYRPVRSPLTSREWEVLDLLCAGRSADGIADELVISTETVRTHLKNVMRKLGARTCADVIASAPRLRSGRRPE